MKNIVEKIHRQVQITAAYLLHCKRERTRKPQTPNTCAMIESIIRGELEEYLYSKGIMADSQGGFRKPLRLP